VIWFLWSECEILVRMTVQYGDTVWATVKFKHEAKDSKEGGPVIVVADMRFWRPSTMTRVDVKDQTDQRIRDNRINSSDLNEPEISISHKKTRFKNDLILNQSIFLQTE
jgi:hypothetical protein